MAANDRQWSHEGSYTQGGILFEGSNFAQWKVSIDRSLASAGLTFHHDQDTLTSTARFTGNVLPHILQHLSPRVRGGVEKTKFTTKQQLYIELEKLSKPFPIMDLPGELRNMIYTCTFETDKVQNIIPYTSRDGMRKYTTYLPALLQASRQVRCEASSIYFYVSNFTIALNHDYYHSPSIKPLRTMMARWRQDIAKCNTQHVRSMRLCVEVRDARGCSVLSSSSGGETEILSFSANEQGQLLFHCSDRLPDMATTQWSLRVARMNARSKAGGWKGQGLGMLLEENSGFLMATARSPR